MRIVGIDPTGSTWDRTAACPASAALPQVFDGHSNEFRDKGTAIHRFLDRVTQLRRDGVPSDEAELTALGEVEEQWKAVCEQVDVSALAWRTTLSSELAVAYNWKTDTARYLQPVAFRQYEIDPECEVAQTIDFAGVNVPERFLAIGDYKGPWAYLPEPARSLQLGGAALALARIHKARRAHVEFIRVRSDGTVSPWRAELDVFALESVAERLQAMMRDVERMRADLATDVVPNVTEGPWCGGCPARTHCPAKTALVRSVLAGDAKHKLSLREPITAENVGSVYAMLKKVREATKYVEKAIRAYEADGAPSTPEQLSPSAIPLGVDDDGSLRYFGRFERQGNEKIDGKIALEVLRKTYPESDNSLLEPAFEMVTSKDAIRDVIRANKPADQTLKAAEEEVLAAIRSSGGATKPPTDKPTEFTIAADGRAKKATRKKAS